MELHLSQPLGNQAGDDLSSVGEGLGVGVSGCVEIRTVGGSLDEHSLLGGLGQHGVVGHSQGVPGVDGARGQGDVGACDVHVAVLQVDPVHLFEVATINMMSHGYCAQKLHQT